MAAAAAVLVVVPAAAAVAFIVAAPDVATAMGMPCAAPPPPEAESWPGPCGLAMGVAGAKEMVRPSPMSSSDAVSSLSLSAPGRCDSENPEARRLVRDVPRAMGRLSGRTTSPFNMRRANLLSLAHRCFNLVIQARWAAADLRCGARLPFIRWGLCDAMAMSEGSADWHSRERHWLVVWLGARVRDDAVWCWRGRRC